LNKAAIDALIDTLIQTKKITSIYQNNISKRNTEALDLIKSAFGENITAIAMSQLKFKNENS
jgi:hypothetical protein